MTIVTDAEVTLLEDVEPGINLQNTGLAVAEELGLERELCLMSSLCRFLNYLVQFEGEGGEDPCHHDVVQCSPIGGWIDDVREDVVIQAVSMKREEHEVTLSLVVGRGDKGSRTTVTTDHMFWLSAACTHRYVMRAASGLESVSTE
jgi:hypothetical protein